MSEKIYKFKGVKYYYRKRNWYHAETNIQVHHELANKLTWFFYSKKKETSYERLKREYPSISKGRSVEGFSGGLPGSGKKK